MFSRNIAKPQALSCRVAATTAASVVRLTIRNKSTIQPVKSKSSTSDAKKKFSSWKLYALTFAVGGVLGLNLPMYDVLESVIAGGESKAIKNEADLKQYQMDLENKLDKLAIVQKLKQDPNYVKIRAWENIDDSSVFSETMTSKTLREPGGIAIEPMIFINESQKETVTLIHVGNKLVGYPFLIHGGILATILDETSKRCSILHFNNTHRHLKYDDESTYAHIKGEHLTLSYKFPTLADNFIVVRCKCVDEEPLQKQQPQLQGKKDKNKVLVKATVENLNGRPLVLGDGIFVNENGSIISSLYNKLFTKWW